MAYKRSVLASGPDKFTNIRYCFDASSHLLLSQSIHSNHDLELWFQNYQEVDGMRFPGSIRFLEDGTKAAMEVRNVAAIKMAIDPASFIPPPGANSFRTCQHLMPPHSVKRVDPEYPSIARMQNVSGKVHLLVKVADDGKVQKIRLISGHPFLVEAAMNAVKHWEYKPAVCSLGPVETQIAVTVQFHLGSKWSTPSTGATGR
jgi:TonB family protein